MRFDAPAPGGRTVAALAGLGLTGGLLLTGCGSAGSPATTGETALSGATTSTCPTSSGSVVLAGSAHTGSAVPELTPAVASAVRDAVEHATYVGMVSTDGKPRVLFGRQVTITASNGEVRTKQREAWTASITKAVGAARATQPETDPLAALSLAAREVHGHGGAGTVVLVDSGLQTTGALRYQDPGLLLAEPQELAAALQRNGGLPDLSGVTVVLVGIGDTAAPQAKPDEAVHTRLVDQWQAVARAAGADCVAVDPTPLTTSPAGDLPPVTAVAVPTTARPVLTSGRAVLHGDVVGFAPNTATLLDPAAATDRLRDIATELRRTDARVLLTGTTATDGSEQWRSTLSRQRAEALKGLLVKLGVSADRVTTTGAGTHDPSHVPDTRPDGTLDPDKAALNRSVVVTVQP